MTIKKAYLQLASLLAANMDALVSDIYEQAAELMSASTKGGGGVSCYHKNDEGEVVALRCSYHQKWFDPAEVEFGKKASSSSGYNTMCKDGLAKWTKQFNNFKKAKEQLLDDLSEGTVEPSEIVDITAALENTRQIIVPMEDHEGYDTLEELLAA